MAETRLLDPMQALTVAANAAGGMVQIERRTTQATEPGVKYRTSTENVNHDRPAVYMIDPMSGVSDSQALSDSFRLACKTGTKYQEHGGSTLALSIIGGDGASQTAFAGDSVHAAFVFKKQPDGKYKGEVRLLNELHALSPYHTAIIMESASMDTYARAKEDPASFSTQGNFRQIIKDGGFVLHMVASDGMIDSLDTIIPEHEHFNKDGQSTEDARKEMHRELQILQMLEADQKTEYMQTMATSERSKVIAVEYLDGRIKAEDKAKYAAECKGSEDGLQVKVVEILEGAISQIDQTQPMSDCDLYRAAIDTVRDEEIFSHYQFVRATGSVEKENGLGSLSQLMAIMNLDDDLKQAQIEKMKVDALAAESRSIAFRYMFARWNKEGVEEKKSLEETYPNQVSVVLEDIDKGFRKYREKVVEALQSMMKIVWATKNRHKWNIRHVGQILLSRAAETATGKHDNTGLALYRQDTLGTPSVLLAIKDGNGHDGRTVSHAISKALAEQGFCREVFAREQADEAALFIGSQEWGAVNDRASLDTNGMLVGEYMTLLSSLEERGVCFDVNYEGVLQTVTPEGVKAIETMMHIYADNQERMVKVPLRELVEDHQLSATQSGPSLGLVLRDASWQEVEGLGLALDVSDYTVGVYKGIVMTLNESDPIRSNMRFDTDTQRLIVTEEAAIQAVRDVSALGSADFTGTYALRPGDLQSIVEQAEALGGQTPDLTI